MKDRIMNVFIEEILDKSMKFTMDDLARRLGISKSCSLSFVFEN